MQIRLHGTKAEVEIVANLLKQAATDQDLFEIVSERGDYTDRGSSTLVRRYLEIRL